MLRIHPKKFIRLALTFAIINGACMTPVQAEPVSAIKSIGMFLKRLVGVSSETQAVKEAEAAVKEAEAAKKAVAMKSVKDAQENLNKNKPNTLDLPDHNANQANGASQAPLSVMKLEEKDLKWLSEHNNRDSSSQPSSRNASQPEDSVNTKPPTKNKTPPDTADRSKQYSSAYLQRTLKTCVKNKVRADPKLKEDEAESYCERAFFSCIDRQSLVVANVAIRCRAEANDERLNSGLAYSKN